MDKNAVLKFLRPFALFGNILYILWIVYNGIDEGFRNIRSLQAMVLLGLICPLILNFILIKKNN